MLQKLNIKTLLIILIILGGLVALNYGLKSKHGDRNFENNIAKIDTSRVDNIAFSNSTFNYALEKTPSGWVVDIAGEKHGTDARAISGLLSELSDIKIERMASKSSDKWKKYEVDDSLGVKMTVKSGSEKLAEWVIGKFSYKQLGGNNPMAGGRNNMKLTTYLRDANQEAVFAINGMLGSLGKGKADAFRKRSFFDDLDKKDLTKIAFNYPDSAFVLQKINQKWMIEDLPTDSTATAQFLTALASLRGQEFTDKPVDAPLFKINLERANHSPTEIAVYTGEGDTYILGSSDNPDNYFLDKNKVLTKKIAVSRSKFVGN